MGKGSGYRWKFVRGVIFAGVVVFTSHAVAQDEPLVLQVRHDHAVGSCEGTLVLENQGVRYETTDSEDARVWSYADIKQFQIEPPSRIKVYTYEDRKWRLGADKVFQFDWEDEKVTPEQVYEYLKHRTPLPIAAWLRPSETGRVRFEFPVKHLGNWRGRQGRLLFTDEAVILESAEPGASRVWRYEDLEGVASGGVYDLSLATYEQQRFQYGSRRVYNFQLKQPMPRETYDELWRFVNGKKGWELLGVEKNRERVF